MARNPIPVNLDARNSPTPCAPPPRRCEPMGYRPTRPPARRPEWARRDLPDALGPRDSPRPTAPLYREGEANLIVAVALAALMLSIFRLWP